MQLFGEDRGLEEVRKRIGGTDQLGGVKLVQFDEGNERPTRAALFHTADGLEFTVLLDRCLDISSARYRGKSLCWRSTTGDVAPSYYEPEGLRWLRSFYGGLLTTCGLTDVGAPPEDSALTGRGVHGRIGNLPAKDIKTTQAWRHGDYVMSVSGTMRETRVFGEKLALTRTVSTSLNSPRIRLEDVLMNEGFEETPFMLLYHCNIGWPAVEDGGEVMLPSRRLAPRDDDAKQGVEDWYKLEAPTHGYAEKVWYHDLEAGPDGWVTAGVANPGILGGQGEPFGVYVRYKQDNLPRFTHWKNMGEQEYVVGLEPCNCGVQGRETDEREGLLHRLKPGQALTYELEFGPLTSPDEVDALRNARRKAGGEIVQDYREFAPKPS